MNFDVVRAKTLNMKIVFGSTRSLFNTRKLSKLGILWMDSISECSFHVDREFLNTT